MKLAITSDLHLPKTPTETITKLIADITAEKPDAVIIAGDIGESSQSTATCLSLFRPIQCPVLVIAGNHDLFPDTHSSKRLWEEILPRTVQEFGYHWLENSPYIKNSMLSLAQIRCNFRRSTLPLHPSRRTALFRL
jgi:DNA repair exonuclease SbcCD nuclease subunit